MLDILKNEVLPYAEKYCESDWDKIVFALNQGMGLYKKARTEGVLSLEDNVEDLEPKYMYDFVERVLEAFDILEIEDMMTTYFYVNKFSGLDAYLFLINCSMILTLPCAGWENLFEVAIKSILPSKYYEKLPDIKSYFEDRSDESKAILSLIAQGKAEEIFNFHLVELEPDFIEDLGEHADFSLQEMIRRAEDKTIAAALQYATPSMINRFFKNMSDSKALAVVRALKWHVERDDWSRNEAYAARDKLRKH